MWDKSGEILKIFCGGLESEVFIIIDEVEENFTIVVRIGNDIFF